METIAEGGGKGLARMVEPTVARSPHTRSPVTFVGLLPEVREEGRAGMSLDALVAAVEEADGCKPHHSLALLGEIMGDLLVGAGTTGPPLGSCALSGTEERRFCRPPDPGCDSKETIVSTEKRHFRRPTDPWCGGSGPFWSDF